MNYLASLIIPLIVLIIIIYGLIKKVDIYNTFVEGAKEGMGMSINLFPYLLAMIVAINVLLKSNIINVLLAYIKPFFDYLKFPSQVLPLALMRPISGSSSLVILNSILIDYGPDSMIGRLASVIQGSTDTTIYVITLYFGSIGIKKIRYALAVGLLADLMAIIISVIMVTIVF